jgi:hypothetical protein
MERLFSIEAKSFRFSSKEGSSLFRLEERRKKFVGFILVSNQGSSWLIDTVEAASQTKEDIAKSFREGDKALMVHGGANKAGRFLEVAVYAEGGRKGAVWLPEGRDGRGWRRFAGELRRFLASTESKSEAGVSVLCSSPSVKPSPIKLAEARATVDCRSFAEVLRSKPRCEVKSGGVDLENKEDGERLRTAGSEGKTKGSAVKAWASQMLGFVHLGMGRVMAGLLEGILNGPEGISIRKRVKAVLNSLDGPMGCGVGPPPSCTYPGRVKGRRVTRLKAQRFGVGFPIKSRVPATRRLRPRRVRPLVSENTSLGATMQVPEVRLGASEVVFSVPERDLGGDSGAAGEGFSPVSPLLAVGSVNASFPVIESCVGATEAGLPANEGISSGAEPIPPLAMIPACSLSSVSDIVSGTLVEVPVGDLGEYLEQEGSFRRISQDITKDGKDENVKDCVSLSAQTESYEIRLEAPEPSDDGLQVMQLEDVVIGHDQGVVSEPKWVSVPESPLHTAGLDLEGTVSGSEPSPLAVISAEESGFPFSAVVPIDAGNGSSQLPAPGFSVPSAEELFGFLPAGSMSKDWEEFYSSLSTAYVGLSDSEIIKEAFALPWEVEVPASQSCKEEYVPSSGAEINQVVRPTAPARSLLRRGFLGPRAVSPSSVVLKEVSPVIKGKEPATEDESCAVPSFSAPVLPTVILPSMQEDKQGVQSTVAAVSPSAQVCPSSVGTDVTKPIPFNSSGSWWYTRRVKEKLAKQLNKNKELIAEAVGVKHVVREDRVADTLNLAPVLGLSWGGEHKKFQDLVEATVPKVKGMRELKNLDCAISPVKGKRRRGWSGSKNACSFPPEVH